ncbi:MAG: sodium:solute symporter family protein [Methanobacteriaceae archaeon]|nr:sodium:solute symporter family protein [Methanobacteriaceae archaeon]
MDLLILTVIILVYLLVVGYVGYIGWKRTKNSADYMVAGRKTNPYIMAMSYGATFISTAAIVGFGGTAGLYGIGLLWLVFLNIFVGIFIAFVFFGKRTRKMGHNLDAMTFPELIARRFDSKFIQYCTGLIIFCAMPIYAGVVLIGAARFIETTLSIDFNIALVIMAIIVAIYVVLGGIRGVMYTDALQGTIMFLAMLFLLIATYVLLGGVENAHQALTNISSLVPSQAAATGSTGWTSMPTMGSPFWWTLVSTIILGVGLGVLAQPQLAVRFMTVKSNRELNRAVLIGGLFILIIPGTAYIVGALSNVYFLKTLNQISIVVAGGNLDKIIPIFINSAMPEWFSYVFLLVLLAAAMSTLSSQFHAQGTAIGRDFYETLFKKDTHKSILITRAGVIIGVLIALILGFILPGSVIAQGTAIFFGICVSAFLPMFICALFWKRATKEGAISGLIIGTVVSLFWLIFIHKKEAAALGISKALFGTETLIMTMPWPVVDPLVVALPLALAVTIIVSLITKPPNEKHLEKCFNGIN